MQLDNLARLAALAKALETVQTEATPAIEDIHAMIIAAGQDLAALAEALEQMRPAIATAADPKRTAHAVRKAAIAVHITFRPLMNQLGRVLAED